MSQENVRIVGRIYEELNSRKVFPPELFAPDRVTDWTDVAPGGDVLHGIDVTQRELSRYFDTFDDFHVSAEVLHADQNRVITAIRDGGRMKASAAEIWSDYFHAWRECPAGASAELLTEAVERATQLLTEAVEFPGGAWAIGVSSPSVGWMIGNVDEAKGV